MNSFFKSTTPQPFQVGDSFFGGVGKPCLMGIINATPDSFFDGGKNNTVALALERALSMVDSGVEILDVGGESTRPGAQKVSASEELDRVLPIIEALSSLDVVLSIDTMKCEVAKQAFEAGASILNDVSALKADAKMKSWVVNNKAPVILNHMQGTPQSMQNNPSYKSVLQEVKTELLQTANELIGLGLHSSQIALDPGIGFGKQQEHNYELLWSLSELVKEGFPVLLGTSRKSFIGEITGKEASERLAGSLATISETYRQGASIFRVHDVAETVDLLKMIDAIQKGK